LTASSTDAVALVTLEFSRGRLAQVIQNRLCKAGRQWRPAQQPRRVQTHDFPAPDVPRAYPYGIYDIGRNTGFVNLGTDHDTGAFAVASIRGWWHREGRHLYPHATQMRITAAAGGSNGWRLRLWKLELQRLADDTSLARRSQGALPVARTEASDLHALRVREERNTDAHARREETVAQRRATD